MIRKAINDTCKLPVLGVIPRFKKDPLPERHMGLTPFQEHPDVEKSIAYIRGIGSKYLDLDSIWKLAQKAGTIPPLKTSSLKSSGIKTKTAGLKIGIIKDSAFQFYYPENLTELEKRGAKLIKVSPLKESGLPDIDALYIGGGFPETHAIALSKNTGFRKSLRQAIERGLPVYAECGGLIYLGKSLILKGRKYPMTGIFPIVFGMEKKPQAHGYTIIKVKKANPFFPQNITLKGHEFHYSRITEMKEEEGIDMAFKVQRGNGIKNSMDGICYKNVLATYTHLHALGNPEWTEGLIKCSIKFKKKRKKENR
ncbi:MAG: hydrogenobyrinic acid a,c-diamide synthase (glutamine-hydrolyzing) [Candidatus Mariimomonas ferrooxydans]